MEIDELKEWLKERISALDGPLVQNGDLVRAKTYAEVLIKLEEPPAKLPDKLPLWLVKWLSTQPRLTLKYSLIGELQGGQSQQITDD